MIVVLPLEMPDELQDTAIAWSSNLLGATNEVVFLQFTDRAYEYYKVSVEYFCNVKRRKYKDSEKVLIGRVYLPPQKETDEKTN